MPRGLRLYMTDKIAHTGFFKRKYKLKEAFSRYMRDVYMISKRRKLNLKEKAALRRYLHAIRILKEARVLDIARCATAFGRNLTGKPLEIWQAIPIVIGRGVVRPIDVDLEYLEILLEYAIELQEHKRNIKDFFLRITLTSRYSPVTPYFTAQLQNVIEETKARIRQYRAT